jgi:hypothetical protein
MISLAPIRQFFIEFYRATLGKGAERPAGSAESKSSKAPLHISDTYASENGSPEQRTRTCQNFRASATPFSPQPEKPLIAQMVDIPIDGLSCNQVLEARDLEDESKLLDAMLAGLKHRGADVSGLIRVFKPNSHGVIDITPYVRSSRRATEIAFQLAKCVSQFERRACVSNLSDSDWDEMAAAVNTYFANVAEEQHSNQTGAKDGNETDRQERVPSPNANEDRALLAQRLARRKEAAARADRAAFIDAEDRRDLAKTDEMRASERRASVLEEQNSPPSGPRRRHPGPYPV